MLRASFIHDENRTGASKPARRQRAKLLRMRQIEGREWWLWGFAVAVTLVLTLGILALTYSHFRIYANDSYSVNLNE
jgi:hypothetical protein